MPLIRYETGDIAQALDGPCPCDRTLPSFGQIRGRRSRIASVPQEVLGLADTVLEAMAVWISMMSAQRWPTSRIL